ncbi:MAG: hypothetical protein U0350_46130 [Caldilineaceae bacterium]
MQHRFSYLPSWRGITASLLLFTLFVFAACQPIRPVATDASPGAGGAAISPITITAKDYAFDLPAELPAGLVSLTLRNEGKVNHHGIVMRLKDGVTLDQLKTVLQDPRGNPMSVSDLSFFMPDTGPGLSNQATVELAPGNWVILSVSMDSPDHTPDWTHGSLQPFTVKAGANNTSAPKADLVLTISKADADMPAEVSAGQHTIQIVNASDKADGWAFFLKLEGDTTVKDILAMFDAFFSGKQPEKMAEFTPVGGLMGYNLGNSFYTTVNFTPGNYAVITSINAKDFPYTGLAKTFTVKGEANAGGSADQAARFPEGIFATSVISAEISDASLKGNVGDWQISFVHKDATSGVFDRAKGPYVTSKGDFTVKGEQLLLHDISPNCQENPDATYTWRSEGETLTLTAVEDKCAARNLVLNHALHQQITTTMTSTITTTATAPKGVFMATVQASDVPTTTSLPWGDLYLQFTAKDEYSGEFVYNMGNDAPLHGSYRVDGNILSISDEDCSAKHSDPGKYTWTLAGDVLKLQKRVDVCSGRNDMLEHVTFKASKAKIPAADLPQTVAFASGLVMDRAVGITNSGDMLDGFAAESYGPEDWGQVNRTFTNTITLHEERPLVFVMGWCTDTPARMKETLPTQQLKFSVDGKEIPMEQLRVLESGSPDHICHSWQARFSQWPQGETAIVLDLTYTKAIADGFGTDYKPGTQKWLYVVKR